MPSYVSAYTVQKLFLSIVLAAFVYQLCAVCHQNYLLYLVGLCGMASFTILWLHHTMRGVHFFLMYTHFCQDAARGFLSLLETYDIFPTGNDFNYERGYNNIQRHLQRISQLIVLTYVAPVWVYLSYSPSFLNVLHTHLLGTLERLTDRILHLDISNLAVKAIWIKALLFQHHHSLSANMPTHLAEMDTEAQNVRIKAIFRRLLHEYAPQPTSRHFRRGNYQRKSTKSSPEIVAEYQEALPDFVEELSTEIVWQECMLPMVDMISSPRIFYILWTALLITKPIDVFVRECSELKRRGDVSPFAEHPLSAETSGIHLQPETDPVAANPTPPPDRDHTLHQTSVSDIVSPLSVNGPTNSTAMRISITSIAIPFTRSRRDASNKPFSTYVIQLTQSTSTNNETISTIQREVEHRFREFITLHKLVQKNADFRGIRGPSLFSFTMPTLNTTARVEQRREFLEDYLKKLCERDSSLSFKPLADFLEKEAWISIDPTHAANRNPHGADDMVTHNSLSKLQSEEVDTSSSEVAFPSTSHDSPSNTSMTNQHSNIGHISLPNILDLETTGPQETAHFGSVPSKTVESKDSHDSPWHSMPYLPSYNETYRSSDGVVKELAPCNPGFLLPKSLSQLVQGHLRPVPWMASFRRLVLCYRPLVTLSSRPQKPQSRRWWRPWGHKTADEKELCPSGTVSDQDASLLLCCGPTWRKSSHFVWNVLSILVDPIIQHYFEDLLEPSCIASYLGLLIDVFFPADPSQPTVVKLCESFTEEELRLAAACSFIEALPVIAYHFVCREQLGEVVSELLRDCSDAKRNRLFIFQLLQMVSEELLPST